MRIRRLVQRLLHRKADIIKVAAGDLGPQLLSQQLLGFEEQSVDKEKGVLFSQVEGPIFSRYHPLATLTRTFPYPRFHS